MGNINKKSTKADTVSENAPNNVIDDLRNSIDKIDGKILGLINERLLLAKEIGKMKAKKGKKVLDIAREKAVIEKLKTLNKGLLGEQALNHIFSEIIAASRAIQNHHSVAYLGPEATFSHIATMSYFGRSVNYVPQATIGDIFKEVEKGSCLYGVVPVENSIEGSVNYTLDLFFESDLKICSELYHPISHDLLSTVDSISKIKVIYSHRQVFPQCRNWIQKNLPEAELIECDSTANAARRACDDPNSAAIASSMAAHIYKLHVIASKIEDVSRNTTRFLVIGKDETRRTGVDKTSIMFVTPNVSGALYKILKPIAESEINMVKLESRPTKHENWSYFFFVDIEGHINDPVVSSTIKKMNKICLYLKCLGSYPMAKNTI
ncbi:MAG: prephenate dehydratase [Proteobacteria bacterium]|nr:prephenate dehydratase [Pseudomonadota bacterium]